MRFGDISRVPSPAIAFHWDCLFEDRKNLPRFVSNIGAHVSLFFNKRLRPGAAHFSQHVMSTTDYSLLVVGFQPQVSLAGDPVNTRNILEDTYGFVTSRCLFFAEEADLRQTLTEQTYIELYYDTDEDRLARISIRARPFSGWSLVGQ